MVYEELIRLRSLIKRRKPDFKQDGFLAKKRIRNNNRWRKPRGSQSKMRLGKKGHPIKRKSGYASPRKVRGAFKNGLRPLLIYNPTQLDDFDKERYAPVIASSVGMKKRVEIIKKALEKGIDIYNVKNAHEYLKSVEEKLKKRKEHSLKESAIKKEKPTEKKKENMKRDIEEKLDEEEKKEQEKREWEKILTHK